MINAFIIHSGNDANYVLDNLVPKLLETTEEKNCHTNILMCGSEKYKDKYDEIRQKLKLDANQADNFVVDYTSQNWKRVAKQYIKRSNVVIVVIGKDTVQPEKAKTVGFEVDYAEKCGKLVLFHIHDNVTLPTFLMEKDKFTGKLRGKSKNYSLDEIRERIDNYDKGYYDIFSDEKYHNPEMVKANLGSIIDQYKMYQKTSEDLVSRRQTVSSFYISVNSALVALSSLIMGLVKYPNNIAVILMMAFIGIILDLSWMKLLEAYGSLNQAKMKVISLLESQLPVSLYDTEWQVMSDKMNKTKYVSFTDSEKRIPKIFMFIYGIMIIGAVTVLCLRFFGVI